MISKELLSEVLHQDITAFSIKGNTLFYQCTDYFDDCINIYELAYLCKEWALKQGYELRTSTRAIVDVYDHINIDSVSGLMGEFIGCRHEANTEPEAIFKACEYILKEHPCNQLT